MHTNTHSTQECCGFVWALFPCLVSCAGSGSVVAPELMVSRVFYRRRAECCMFRSSCFNLTTLRLWLHSSKLVSCCMRHPGYPGVRPEACAHQIQHVGGRRSSVVLSPNAELRPCVDRSLISSPLPSVCSDVPGGARLQSCFQRFSNLRRKNPPVLHRR